MYKVMIITYIKDEAVSSAIVEVATEGQVDRVIQNAIYANDELQFQRQGVSVYAFQLL